MGDAPSSSDVLDVTVLQRRIPIAHRSVITRKVFRVNTAPTA